jgi:predicted transcriptional regulator
MTQSRSARRSHNALPNAVGELELKVLECVWQTPGTDARQITWELAKDAPCRLSTVQASLERLVRKEFLQREKEGHAYRYYAARSRSDLLGSMLKDVIRLLHDGQANTILSSFVNVAAGLNSNALDELEALIQRKRRLRSEGHNDD